MMLPVRFSDKKIPILVLVLLGIILAIFLISYYNIFMKSKPPKPVAVEILTVLAQAPCLGTLCVGDVGRETIVDKLSQNNLLYNVNDNTFTIISFTMRESIIGRVNLDYGVVEYITLNLPEIPLAVALDILGQPDEIFLMYGCGQGTHVQARLYYTEGIEVVLQYAATRQEKRDRGAKVVLNSDTPVIGVIYFDPTRYNEWLEGTIDRRYWTSGYFIFPRDITGADIIAAIQPWPGTGEPIKALDLCPR